MGRRIIFINSSQLVWDHWENIAKDHPDRQAIIHWNAFEEPFRWKYAALVKSALNVAVRLLNEGVNPGDICALIMRHNKFFYPVYMGITAIGAIPTVLAYPNSRLHPDKFVGGLLGMAKHSRLDWILMEKELENVIKPLVSDNNNSIKGFLFPLDWDINNNCDDAQLACIRAKRSSLNCLDPFLLQHSSGTTGLQKGVMLSHKAVLEHVKRYAAAVKLNMKDKVASWLPLYHDMGLIAAFHLPLSFGIPTIQIDPFQWISAPVLLLQAISEEKATLSWLPNFAYNFMADRIKGSDMDGIDLKTVRMFVNCSERVHNESHEKFYIRFSEYGVKKDSLSVCYAMAETTFALTQTKPGLQAATLELDREAFSKGYVISAIKSAATKRVCVSSGTPVSGCELKIVGETGEILPEDRVGEIIVRSVSMFDGYLNNPGKTKEVINNGWYLTGDYGFCHQGEYYIIGRKKDIIIVAGKNIYPEDIESVINYVSGVIPGRVIAFGKEDSSMGTEKACVIAETLYNEQDKQELKMKIIGAVMAIDITISEVYLVPPRWLIKSSSGKPCRRTNKERILGKDIPEIKSSHS